MNSKPKVPVSDRERLIQGWEKRIKHHQKQLAETKKFHRGVEAELVKKIKLEQMQLAALRKSK